MKLLDGRKIFVIEDDAINIMMITNLLIQSGAQIEANVLGYDILSHILESMPVDLIILDISLRKQQNGYYVFDKIRSNQLLKDIPILLVTSADWETGIPRAKAMGANGFIAKPINIVGFPKAIEEVLQGESVWIAEQ